MNGKHLLTPADLTDIETIMKEGKTEEAVLTKLAVIDTRLVHGAEKMEDHETRIRSIEKRNPWVLLVAASIGALAGNVKSIVSKLAGG